MSLRSLLCLCVVTTSACSKAPAPASPAPELRYLEHLTGGARPDERVPMMVVLHPMGGDPESMLELLQRYPKRARLILPYGYPRGGKYVWFTEARSDLPAAVVRHETERLVALMAALQATKPTLGKPLVTGFSQGGLVSFALAVTHPEAISAALPIGGTLPPALYPSAAVSSTPRPAVLPPVFAFHGAEDLAVPTQGARDSIVELRRAGYRAELREYPGLAHTLSDEELNDVLQQLSQLAAEE